MRHRYLCTAAILAATILGEAGLSSGQAISTRPSMTDSSPVLVLNMRSYRWVLPEFRMAGRDAYVIVQVENKHSYPLEMVVSCRTSDGRIPEMSGYYTIPPRQYLRMDTRRMHDPLQEGEGVNVRCRFRADGSAKVEAWKYDEKIQLSGASS